MIALAPRAGSKDSWYEFKIHSLVKDSWVEHSRGLVRVEEDLKKVAARDILKPLINSTPGALWYQAMEEVGYALGPAFQKHLEAESLSGTRTSRSLVSLREPPSAFAQSKYQMHPTSVDGILQACSPALSNGNRTNLKAVIIPSIIDEIVISSQPATTTTGMAVVSSSYSGLRDPNDTKNYTADVCVYDIESGLLLFQVSKLRTSVLNTRAISHIDPTYCFLSWKPDITFLSEKALGSLGNIQKTEFNSDWVAINEVIDLIAFKTPNLRVFEGVTISDDSSSIWLDNVFESSGVRKAYESFQLSHANATTLFATQEKYGMHTSAAFISDDIDGVSLDESLTKMKFDLVIARLLSPSQEAVENTVRNAQVMLREGGHLLLLGYTENGAGSDIEELSLSVDASSHIFNAMGFEDVRSVPLSGSPAVTSAFVAAKKIERSVNRAPQLINMLHFLPISAIGSRILEDLKKSGWEIVIHSYPFESTELDGITMILDDLESPLLSAIGQEQWATLQALCISRSRILWLTEGSQFQVTKPENAQIHGLVRTIRDEDPSISFTTLDLDDCIGKHTIPSVLAILDFLQNATFQKTGDYEFVERRGQIYISRVLPDYGMNNSAKAEREGADIVTRPLHYTRSQLRTVCERVGNLDSLKFHEISAKEQPLGEEEVEVEVAAAGINFKDIAISTGLIPGNEKMLGFEEAGTIRRTTSDLYRVGQRVMFAKAGSFANRVTVEPELIYSIPDSMKFEEAATLGAVYPVALYSLFDMANTQKGQRVLVHSAAGGLGIACIQLCQYIGAKIYAMVGNNDKGQFLIDTFGIDPFKIFSSRSTIFAAELMKATNGEGVDVIINSLTGDLLEESWSFIRDGGTMIELGKRDIIERNYLPMEPFSRNVSYRSFDISHKSVPKLVMSRLLKQVSDLIADGHIKPISPTTVFPFDDIKSAFRYIRDGKHMGKIVISNGSQVDVQIQARKALQSMKLRDDVGYLIVGGLKGLCGSIPLSFARHGASHLIVMGRSGFDDKASQTVIRNIEAEGCEIHVVTADVTIEQDVKRAFARATKPVGGIVQGAMVVRGKLYQAMTTKDYHVAVACKVQGTWNLHNVALEKKLTLDFFIFLSSTSGVAGQSGQANYVAANVFLDAFAIFRRNQGLRSNSIALGPIWDVGYMSRNKTSLPQTNVSTFTTITEALFHKIIEYSVLQQIDVINEESASHLITGMAILLKESSTLRSDARFSGLFGSATSGHTLGAKGASKELQTFNLLYQSNADPGQILNALVELVGLQLMTILQLNEPVEPAKSLSSYGMESLSAVELRNWIRMELQADVTMLETLNASSLIALCEKTLKKMQPPVS
ncbi:hypothetical protein MMC25_000049 [Agyrium rufum]|nr:hypothetical protein [Agyrium rufum]